MMGFTPTFYASRPKLSEVTIDSDLDMGGRNITASLVRARQIHAPIDTEEWPTETLDWGDVAPGLRVYELETDSPPITTDDPVELAEFTTPEADTEHWWKFVWVTSAPWTGSTGAVTISVNGVDTATHSLPFTQSVQTTTVYEALPPSAQIKVVFRRTSGSVTLFFRPGSYIECYRVVQASPTKTFDLSGKWLALGIDFGDFAATVKIQGVDIPYSEYVKYFPLAPSELTISGDWTPPYTRPVVEVYK